MKDSGLTFKSFSASDRRRFLKKFTNKMNLTNMFYEGTD